MEEDWEVDAMASDDFVLFEPELYTDCHATAGMIGFLCSDDVSTLGALPTYAFDSAW